MSDEKERAREILAEYRNTISETPELLSLLYDADMLPEQIVTVRGAISVVAVVVAYKAGLAQRDAALKAADELATVMDLPMQSCGKTSRYSYDWHKVDDALSAYRKARGQDNE